LPPFSFAKTLTQFDDATVGKTHASMVTGPVRSSDAASGTVTQLFGANTSALPKRPCVVHVVALVVPLLRFPDTSPAVVPPFSSKP